MNPGLRLLAPGERRGWTPSDAEIQRQRNPHDWDAFPDYVDALRQETMNYSGQVVLVHGDSHSGDFLSRIATGRSGRGPASWVATAHLRRLSRTVRTNNLGLFT